MAGECDSGLNRACFKAHPQWARQAFAYRLLHTLVPKRLSRNLPRAFRIPLIFPGVVIPSDAILPPGSIVGPGSAFLPGWQPGDPLPDGMFYGPTSDFPAGWQPGDPIPAGIIDPSYFPPGFDIEGWFSNLSTDLFPPGPPGPPGASSKSGYPSVSPGVDLTEFEMTGCGMSGYYVPLTDCFDATDDDLGTRAHCKKTAAPGSEVSKIQFNFIGNDQVVNGLRVYSLHNDAGNTWTFGAYMPGFTPLLTGITNNTGWSDVYTFENVVALNQTELRADDALDTLNQESWIYEIELYAF